MLLDLLPPWEISDMVDNTDLRGAALYDALMKLRPDGLAETDWAIKAGVNRGFFTNLKKQDISPRIDSIRKLLRIVNKSEADLYDGSAERAVSGNLRVGAEDEVEIEQWDVSYGMGAGGYVDLPTTGARHTFSRSWLRQFTSAPPEKIFLADGTGDSMFPTILDADKVMIDTTQREVRMADRIWAAAFGEVGIIKRLRPSPDGSVKILSDNPSVPQEVAYDGELHVVGRVVAIMRKT